MTIKREVNGEIMEFDLTWHELVKAFVIMQRNYDKETIQRYMDRTGVEVPEDKMDEIADIYRDAYDEYLDNMAEIRWDIIDDAIKEVLK